MVYNEGAAGVSGVAAGGGSAGGITRTRKAGRRVRSAYALRALDQVSPRRLAGRVTEVTGLVVRERLNRVATEPQSIGKNA